MMLTRQMSLAEAARALPGAAVHGDGAALFQGLSYDSRNTLPGDLFFAVPGHVADGAVFAAAAVAAGASAVVARAPAPLAVPTLVVGDVRAAMARIASRFYGHPSLELVGVGVTGTNGKTTVTTLLAGILDAAGVRAGLLGTVAYRVGGVSSRAARTTPESIDLQRMLREMADAGDRGVAVEVSSHAIALERIAGLALRAMIFTNLTRDHLDFHGTMDAYYETKRRMFRRGDLAALEARVERAVINVDDLYGHRLAAETDLPAMTFSERAGADVTLRVALRTPEGSRLEIGTPRGPITIAFPLPGVFNERNALAAAAAAEALELPHDAVVTALESARGVPGRFQAVPNGLGISVIVDYAHTPDGIDTLLQGVRALVPGRVITVFGCGGNRDQGKRPLMGRAAGGGSDFVVVTSDNPRREDPSAIIADAEPGIRESGTPFEARVDRREAIALAIDRARPGDAVVIAGKGHEETQEVGDRRIPFRDAEVAAVLLREREGRKGEPGAGRG